MAKRPSRLLLRVFWPKKASHGLHHVGRAEHRLDDRVRALRRPTEHAEHHQQEWDLRGAADHQRAHDVVDPADRGGTPDEETRRRRRLDIPHGEVERVGERVVCDHLAGDAGDRRSIVATGSAT